MSRWPWLTRLAAVALVVLGGCGDGGGGEAVGPDPTPPPEAPAPDRGGLSLTLRHTEPLRDRSPVTWTLEVRNGGTVPVELAFSSGQRGEVVLLQGSVERYRWSEGKVFAQALGQVSLPAGQSQSFDLRDQALDVEPGTYDLVATLASRPAPPEVRRRLDVAG